MYRHTVLIVDDDALIADTFATIFRAAGYSALSFHSAEEVLGSSLPWTPSFALVDVLLPAMNGIVLAHRLKHTYPDCQILLHTGQFAASELLDQQERAGHFWTVLPKPTHPSEVLGIAARLVGTSPLLHGGTVDPVSFDDVAFGSAIFVAASQNRLAGRSPLSPDALKRCDQAYFDAVGYPRKAAPPSMTTLHSVYRQMWAGVQESPQQTALCSRILAFHLLMIRTEGRPVQGWTSKVDDDEQEITLDSAVVHAIGSVPLSQGRGICPVAFEAEIRLHAAVQ